VTGRAAITSAYDCVLAWDAGANVGRRELEATRRLVQDVRRDDPRNGRPVLLAPREQLWGYRRLADVLLVSSAPVGAAGPMGFRVSFDHLASSAVRSTPRWTNIPTQLPEELLEQSAVISRQRFTAGVEAAQLQLLTLAAAEAGAAGFCFQSSAALDAEDAVTRHRAASLHALNLELELVEPWIAGPAEHETLDVGLENVVATAWGAPRSKLILLSRRYADDQFTTAPCPPQSVTLLLPGAAASWRAYRIQADRLAPVWSSHVGGGLRIAVPDAGRWTWLVATDDALTINFLSRRLAENVSSRAKLRHEIVSREIEFADQVIQQTPSIPSSPEGARRLTAAQAALRQGQFLLDASDFSGSLLLLQHAEESLAQARRMVWSGAAGAFASRVSSPYCLCFATLPLHEQVLQRVRSSSWGPNLLAASDFEDIQSMQAAGWKQERNLVEGAETLVELSPANPRGGRFALHLGASVENGLGQGRPANDLAAVETPLVRVSSAPAPIALGSLVRISGWVRIDGDDRAAPTLRIADSFGGEGLADFWRSTPDWRPFVLYRAAPGSSPLTVTFELLAPGEAWLDDVRVEVLQ
jgi:hypothetical protein